MTQFIARKKLEELEKTSYQRPETTESTMCALAKKAIENIALLIVKQQNRIKELEEKDRELERYIAILVSCMKELTCSMQDYICDNTNQIEQLDYELRITQLDDVDYFIDLNVEYKREINHKESFIRYLKRKLRRTYSSNNHAFRFRQARRLES